MNGWDFSVLWAAGDAILNGRDPYKVSGFYYPLPFAYLIALFALIPERVAFGVWLAVNALLLVIFLRRAFWKWVLYFPVIHLFSSGQVELLWWCMARVLGRNWTSALIGALMTLKPQSALLLLTFHLWDWLRHSRRTFAAWLGLTAALWAAPLLWRPSWVQDWLAATPAASTGFLGAAQSAPGLFSLTRFAPELVPILAVVGAAIALWGLTQREPITRACLLLASPVGLFYVAMALMDTAPAILLVPLSLIAAVLIVATQSMIPMIALPIAVIGWHFYQSRRQARLRSASVLPTT